MVEDEEDKKVDATAKKGVSAKKKVIIICLIVFVIVVSGVVISQSDLVLVDRSRWITVTFMDDEGYGVIEEPITVRIHPGEKVHFPNVPHTEPSGLELIGWRIYTDDYWGPITEGERVYKTAIIRPDYAVGPTPEAFPEYWGN